MTTRRFTVPPRLGALLRIARSGRGHGAVRLVELVFFALAAPLLGWFLSPADPLGLGSGFPWAAVGPVVFAARYGLGAGVGCTALAVVGALALDAAGLTAALDGHSGGVATLAIGTFLLALVVGDSASAWRRRSLRAEAENEYLRHRQKEFSNDYHVLKASHGQLEEFLIGQRLSLRHALEQVRTTLSATGTGDGLGAGEPLMAVFAQFCSIQVAGLYAMKSETLVDPEPRALHGGMAELPLFDPLLRLALAERRLVSVRLDAAASERHGSELLAVVPIVDSRGHLHGVLAVRDMHFMAFQQKNLDTLALIASYVGDLIARSGGLEDAPAERFVAELDTALRFVRSHDVRSSLVRLRLDPRARGEEIAAFLADGLRSLDAAWLPPVAVGGATTLAVLLPLVGERGASAWLDRAALAVESQFGAALDEALVSTSILPLEHAHDRQECLDFLAADDALRKGRTTSDGHDEGRVDHVA